MNSAPSRVPDLSDRPHRLVVEREMRADPHAIYRAWTEQFDLWFAAPGSVAMTPRVNMPFFFETEYAPKPGTPPTRHPHYGRFLRLEPDRLVELTWVTGRGGTAGAETVVTVELTPHPTGTLLRLTQAGFYDETARAATEAAWRDLVLPHQDRILAGPADTD
ncbi:SRPBCC domain-containing protein [Streptomyces sp. NPDC007172]|uniref:SRPBCC family protein n=1 Tax=unclassified Streptomyces TaxID=2593676 RepID=UPI003679CED3